MNNIWLSAGDLHGPWSRATKLSRDFKKIPDSGKFGPVKSAVPPPDVSNPVIPQVFYSTVPAEVILFDGQPTYTQIPGTQWSTRTTRTAPYLSTAPRKPTTIWPPGRWFSAQNLAGPWTFASLSLPADFASIPLTSPASSILASVPGTSQAKGRRANRTNSHGHASESHNCCCPSQGQLHRRSSIRLHRWHHSAICNQHARQGRSGWRRLLFVSARCMVHVHHRVRSVDNRRSVPQVIYTIPPSSPIYNVTYVTQTTVSDEMSRPATLPAISEPSSWVRQWVPS